MKTLLKLKNFFIKYFNQNKYKAIFRIIEVIKDEEDNYSVLIQLINKSIIIEKTPIEVLSDDALINKFSPRDVRTLTYLGYLTLNSPQYKILAQRYIDSSSEIKFVLKNRKNGEIIISSAKDIVNNDKIINNVSREEVKVLAYTFGSQVVSDEDAIKQFKYDKVK